MISRAELATLCDKSSADPAIVRLYQEHDYLTAYALHTDLRVEHDPQDAIGGLWEEYGDLGRDYLIERGLKPDHKLLDFGCGTGRLARKITPYLEHGRYYGVDISKKALRYAYDLSRAEGWANRLPSFLLYEHITDLKPFDVVWAFSVMIHLPACEVETAFRRIAHVLKPDGRFYFSFVPSFQHTRTGLKQFKHPFGFFRETGEACGLRVKGVSWPGRQRMALAQR